MFLETVAAKLHLLLAALLAAAPAPTAGAAGPTLCTLQDHRIAESSGLAVSHDILWTHNDSGDTARFFALDRHCRTLATYNVMNNVTNETATDWEDMARGGGSLWFGDIGDNAATRSQVQVIRVPEPTVTRGEHGLRATVYLFRYEDGPHDAETLLVHPRTGQLFVVSKSYDGSATVYAAPLHPSATTLNTFTKVAQLQTHVTGTAGGPLGALGQLSLTAGDINATADRIVLRTYTDAY
ncbi:MAG: hypothetical protein QOG99_371, partial [Frankiales bacterium]|nr:hypothetical protein [Frankiales bacterium]